jgi:cysteinyl-tRNA synthetase
VEDETRLPSLELLEQRRDARARKDFIESDRLRDQISALGWMVQDSKEGQKLVKR